MKYGNHYLTKNGTHREFWPTRKRVEVLVLVAAGWESKEISTYLKITEEAVRSRLKYMRLIYKAPNRASLVVRALGSGVLRWEDIAAVPQRYSFETDEEIHHLVGR